jgi:hypothetical protein
MVRSGWVGLLKGWDLSIGADGAGGCVSCIATPGKCRSYCTVTQVSKMPPLRKSVMPLFFPHLGT